MKKGLVFLGVVIVVGLAVFLGWLGYRGAVEPVQEAPPGQQPPASLRTVTVARGDVRQTLVVPVEAVPGLRRALSFPVGGRLAELLVRPGDRVEEGQPLARLDRAPLEEAVARAEAELAARRAELERLKAGPTIPELVEGLAGLGLAVIDFLTAQGELGRLRAVLSSLPRLSGFLDPGPDERELAAARQAVQEAEEALRKARADLAAAVLVAPFPGTVLSVEAEIGESVSPDSPVLVLADLSRMEARATVTQAEVGFVEEGQPVILRFDAFPEVEIRGQVLGIVPEPLGTGGVVTYAVPISLESFPEGLLPGMTGDGEIVLAEKRDVLVLPRRAIRARPDSTVTLKVLTGEGIETRTVRIGLVGELNAEILSGLAEGERVVVER